MNTYGRIQISPHRQVYARKQDAVFHVLSDAPWLQGVETGERITSEGVHLLAPVQPSKIVAIGKNYLAHAQEMGGEVPPEPLLFLKAPSSIIGPEEAIMMPPESKRVDHEGEIAVVIGKIARRVPMENALDYIFGYTCANDVTARDLQKKDGQWARAKSFDTFCPVGPFVVTDLEPTELHVTCSVNKNIRQSGYTKDMAYPIAHLLSYVSQAMTLLPGDIISTGTPEGVGPLQSGDIVEVFVKEIGCLQNHVIQPG
jgi:2-keto-4-pentenoate hydratase/2-oxohepta-3-ene-1,7-dioic acid hydratase in catechol pathway